MATDSRMTVIPQDLVRNLTALVQLREAITTEPAGRVQILQGLLGEAACRQLGIYSLPPGFKLSIVIPVYNEARWIRELLRRVQAVPIPKEIIVVDDCSDDG